MTEPPAIVDVLQLMQWLSPAFPTGGFAYSHGLEWAVAQEDVTDGPAVSAWICDILRFGACWSDAVLLAQALKDDADFTALDDMARALAGSAERWSEAEDQGRAFGDTVAATGGPAGVSLPLVLAFGRAVRGGGLDDTVVIAAYVHAFAANLVLMAVRFVPLGQTEGQQILAGLHAVIGGIAAQAVTADFEDLANSAFGGELAAMAHETLQPRIYRT